MDILQHSAAIHIPLALAILFPLMHVALLILIKVDFLPRRAWLLHWGLCALQVVATAVAYLSGQRDMAMSAGPEGLLSEHRDLAKYFIFTWALLFVALPLAFWQKKFLWSVLFHALLLGLLLAQLVLAVRLGHAGGKLVFG